MGKGDIMSLLYKGSKTGREELDSPSLPNALVEQP